VKPQKGVVVAVGVEVRVEVEAEVMVEVGVAVDGKLGTGPMGKCWIQAKGARHKTINNELIRSFFIFQSPP
jgi:hypothetical protein